MDSNIYIPGSCNIGTQEIKKRIQVGVIGLLITLLAIQLFVHFNFSNWIRFIVFIPATISTVGFLQAKMKFCVFFGFSGIFNFDKVGSLKKVENKADLEKDKHRAKQIFYYSLLIGILIGLLAVFI